jgi:hypothetical protein
MRFITISFFALVASLSVRPADAQTLYTCGDGTVRSVQTIIEMVSGPPVVSMHDRWGEPEQLVELPPAEPRQAYVVAVRLLNATYVAEAFTDAPENFDPTGLEKGEPVSICVNRDRLILERRDGRAFRANVIRIEHAASAKGTR